MKRFLMVCAVLMTLSAANAAPALDALTRIERGDTVNIGVRTASAPFSFVENGQAQGYVVDLCQRIVSSIAAKAGRRNAKIQFVQVTPKNRLDLVASGAIDLECGSTTITETRLKQVEFSNVTFVTGLRLVTRKTAMRDQSEMLSLLRGATVVVVDGATAEKALSWWLGDQTAKILKVADYKAGVEAVAAGKAFAMLGDEILMQSAINGQQTGAELAVSELKYSVEPYGITLRKEDTLLREKVNEALAELYHSGQAEKMLAAWLATKKLAINSLTQELMARPGRYHAMPSI